MSGDEDGDIVQCGTQTSAALRKGRERMRHAPSSSQPQREPREHGGRQSRNAGTEKERSTKTRLIRNNKGTFLQTQQKCTRSLPMPKKKSIRKYLEDCYAYRKIKLTPKIKTPKLVQEENQNFPTENTPAPGTGKD